jgi:hypothetical protein
MHHLKEAEIHKSELAGILEIPIVLGIQIQKIKNVSIFWPFRYPGQGSRACTISRQQNFKRLTLQMFLKHPYYLN